ncbi:oxidoreductase [Haloferax mediterranei ATCC 33500]|uniref:Oxidoreductase n=1 Tax=Haloferax mediterranei (strain ATCC 33500 / DSM 1411 / JCM 8866 / NBRC 14739 / NCIMB 2177 / R-4) TaxID=523841 RepID=I3R365_HALMT|nr:aldo/keto reductase [Haloferax mediterranei]AFK18675.1 oxidoreductase [Haloferax mediterranei ATCC 33500]AHZ21954.1 oxidoreductase [Haloferax mediterranei ATCC 33500]EMA03464.1 oxidoreductase [Haloferax mediterranei ATCC 33500]MDX5988772.1 aldo/keto reductase [Haloferax mediterranei ATCC 33500]QCQ75175.1 oxidoreductase [Haloferax mediterranei ATCC 33500]
MGLDNASGTFDIGGELTVHRLGFGAMRITGADIIGEPDDVENAKKVLHEAVVHGINLIDTADSYGPAVSERLIGEALAPYPDDLVIATKGGFLRNTSGDWIPRADPDYLRNAVLGSLDRLRVDTIDLYQLHQPDPNPDVPFEESVHALAELQDEGQIRHVGLSNITVGQLDEARDIVDIATVQNRYNVGDRESEAVLDACDDYDIGFIPYFPLGAGDLGDKADDVATVATKHEATPQQIAIAWLLHRSDVMLPIPGTSSVAHLRENIAASHIGLDDEDMARLDE